MFYSNNRNEINYCKYQKALCYKNSENYTDATNELNSIYFNTTTDSLYFYVTYQLALCNYLNNDPVKALWKIDEFINRTHDTIGYLNLIPIKILCSNEQQEWESSKADLLFLINSSTCSRDEKQQLINRINFLYTPKQLPRIVNVEKAQTMSKFIPGLGQMYAGNIGEGIINLLINSSVLAFSIHQFYFRYYITGYFAGLGLLNKTYHNSAILAKRVAEESNNEKLSQINQEIISILQKIEK